MQKESLARARSLIHRWTLFASSLSFLLLRGNVEEFFLFHAVASAAPLAKARANSQGASSMPRVGGQCKLGVSQNLGYAFRVPIKC